MDGWVGEGEQLSRLAHVGGDGDPILVRLGLKLSPPLHHHPANNVDHDDDDGDDPSNIAHVDDILLAFAIRTVVIIITGVFVFGIVLEAVAVELRAPRTRPSVPVAPVPENKQT